MNPRRVLHIIRGVKGGVPVVVDQLVRRINRDRYEPIVLFNTHDQSDIRKKLYESDIKTIDFKKGHVDQTPKSFKQSKKLNISGKLEVQFGQEARQLYLTLKSFYKFLTQQTLTIRSFTKVFKEHRVELIHTHNDLLSAKPEIMAAWLIGLPCISHNHGYHRFTAFDLMFVRFVEAFIYISKHVAEHHVSLGKPRAKGTIIHNGVDLSKFLQKYDTVSVREEFGIKPEQVLIGLIGRIDWWKGHEYFLKAMARVIERIPDVRGLIIGDLEKNVAVDRNRKYFNNLKLQVKSLGLSEKIIFTGSRSDIPRLIAALDVVVHASSIPEPFGLVIIEAMASGKPVVATAAGGVLDIIEDGKNGILVPCKDAEAMAEAILQIISNQEKAKQMGIAARNRVAERFTVQHQVTEVQKIYDSILANPRRRKGK